MVEYLFCGSIYEYYIIIPDRDAFYAIQDILFTVFFKKKHTHKKKQSWALF